MKFGKDCWLEIRDLPGDTWFSEWELELYGCLFCVFHIWLDTQEPGKWGLLTGCCSQSVHVTVLSVLLPSTNVTMCLHYSPSYWGFCQREDSVVPRCYFQDVVSHLTAFAWGSGPTSCLVLVKTHLSLCNIRPASPGQVLQASLSSPACPAQLLQASFSMPGQLLHARPASLGQLL